MTQGREPPGCPPGLLQAVVGTRPPRVSLLSTWALRPHLVAWCARKSTLKSPGTDGQPLAPGWTGAKCGPGGSSAAGWGRLPSPTRHVPRGLEVTSPSQWCISCASGAPSPGGLLVFWGPVPVCVLDPMAPRLPSLPHLGPLHSGTFLLQTVLSQRPSVHTHSPCPRGAGDPRGW